MLQHLFPAKHLVKVICGVFIRYLPVFTSLLHFKNFTTGNTHPKIYRASSGICQLFFLTKMKLQRKSRAVTNQLTPGSAVGEGSIAMGGVEVPRQYSEVGRGSTTTKTHAWRGIHTRDELEFVSNWVEECHTFSMAIRLLNLGRMPIRLRCGWALTLQGHSDLTCET